MQSERLPRHPSREHLRPQRHAFLRRGLALGELLAPLARLAVVLREQERDRASGRLRDPAKHLRLADENAHVVGMLADPLKPNGGRCRS